MNTIRNYNWCYTNLELNTIWTYSRLHMNSRVIAIKKYAWFYMNLDVNTITFFLVFIILSVTTMKFIFFSMNLLEIVDWLSTNLWINTIKKRIWSVWLSTIKNYLSFYLNLMLNTIRKYPWFFEFWGQHHNKIIFDLILSPRLIPKRTPLKHVWF